MSLFADPCSFATTDRTEFAKVNERLADAVANVPGFPVRLQELVAVTELIPTAQVTCDVTESAFSIPTGIMNRAIENKSLFTITNLPYIFCTLPTSNENSVTY